MQTVNNETTKRPRSIIRRVKDASDTAWSPVLIPLHYADGIRAGEAYGICRPGAERWPLGIVSKRYKMVDHNSTRDQILGVASDRVQLAGSLVAGHGYNVAFSFVVRHMHAESIDGAPVRTRLVVSHDHTGTGALRASMVVYIGNEALGSIVRSRAIHAGMQPMQWSSEIDSMIEKSILSQDALLDVLRAAKNRVLTDADRTWIASKGIRSRKGKQAKTLLEAVQSYYAGNTTAEKMTWGVWERRLDDEAIRVCCELLGLAKYGTPLDLILGGKRYGKGHTLRNEQSLTM